MHIRNVKPERTNVKPERKAERKEIEEDEVKEKANEACTGGARLAKLMDIWVFQVCLRHIRISSLSEVSGNASHSTARPFERYEYFAPSPA